MRTCKKCGGTYADVFFRHDKRFAQRVARKSEWSPICVGCQQTAKDEKKQENRPLVKARSTYNRHAIIFLKRGIIERRDDLRDVLGWNVAQMAHDIKHAFGNGCPYCHRLFADMPHGLADMTLDILNPALPPYYTTNVKWVCMTDNREKQALPPDVWSARLLAWEQWRKVQANHWGALPLFAELKETPQQRLL